MKIIKSINQMSLISKNARLKGKSIGFVPTMGALHEGHLSLARRARKDTDIVVMSIFVNPAQFGPTEDFKKYPRSLKADCRSAKAVGVDYIFYPDKSEIYPNDFRTYLETEGLSNVLCGKSRPGHFRGVATVVTKLFNIVNPDIAYFGQKDAQQAIIIKRLVKDLNMPIKIKVLPIVREADGLAMSSRNAYLNNEERCDAIVLSQALNLAKRLIKQGKIDSRFIINNMRRLINQKRKVKIEYIEIVEPKDLKPVRFIDSRVLIALAVWVGKTRLIDNVIINSKLKTQSARL